MGWSTTSNRLRNNSLACRSRSSGTLEIIDQMPRTDHSCACGTDPAGAGAAARGGAEPQSNARAAGRHVMRPFVSREPLSNRRLRWARVIGQDAESLRRAQSSLSAFMENYD